MTKWNAAPAVNLSSLSPALRAVAAKVFTDANQLCGLNAQVLPLGYAGTWCWVEGIAEPAIATASTMIYFLDTKRTLIGGARTILNPTKLATASQNGLVDVCEHEYCNGVGLAEHYSAVEGGNPNDAQAEIIPLNPGHTGFSPVNIQALQALYGSSQLPPAPVRPSPKPAPVHPTISAIVGRTH